VRALPGPEPGFIGRQPHRDERVFDVADEFRVEDGLIVLGPLPSADMLPSLIEDLEQSGLVYFDDFFDLSGNWPNWLALYARAVKTRRS